jgi:hypothetical protein
VKSTHVFFDQLVGLHKHAALEEVMSFSAKKGE